MIIKGRPPELAREPLPPRALSTPAPNVLRPRYQPYKWRVPHGQGLLATLSVAPTPTNKNVKYKKLKHKFNTSCTAGSMSRLLAPAATNSRCRAASSSGSVNVTRRGGALGESVIGAISFLVSVSSSWAGKSEHMCPSSPMPSKIKSNDGIFPVLHSVRSLDSYSSALADSSSDVSTAATWEIWKEVWAARASKSCVEHSLKFESLWSRGTARSSLKYTLHLQNSMRSRRWISPGATMAGRDPPENATKNFPSVFSHQKDFSNYYMRGVEGTIPISLFRFEQKKRGQ